MFDVNTMEVRKSRKVSDLELLLPVSGIRMNPECQSILLMSRSRCVLDPACSEEK